MCLGFLMPVGTETCQSQPGGHNPASLVVLCTKPSHPTQQYGLWHSKEGFSELELL